MTVERQKRNRTNIQILKKKNMYDTYLEWSLPYDDSQMGWNLPEAIFIFSGNPSPTLNPLKSANIVKHNSGKGQNEIKHIPSLKAAIIR